MLRGGLLRRFIAVAYMSVQLMSGGAAYDAGTGGAGAEAVHILGVALAPESSAALNAAINRAADRAVETAEETAAAAPVVTGALSGPVVPAVSPTSSAPELKPICELQLLYAPGHRYDQHLVTLSIYVRNNLAFSAFRLYLEDAEDAGGAHAAAGGAPAADAVQKALALGVSNLTAGAALVQGYNVAKASENGELIGFAPQAAGYDVPPSVVGGGLGFQLLASLSAPRAAWGRRVCARAATVAAGGGGADDGFAASAGGVGCSLGGCATLGQGPSSAGAPHSALPAARAGAPRPPRAQSTSWLILTVNVTGNERAAMTAKQSRTLCRAIAAAACVPSLTPRSVRVLTLRQLCGPRCQARALDATEKAAVEEGTERAYAVASRKEDILWGVKEGATALEQAREALDIGTRAPHCTRCTAPTHTDGRVRPATGVFYHLFRGRFTAH
jgi:hypothetical protein